MNNLKENFLILLSIVKQSLQNVLDANGNLPKPGPEPKFSDAEVISSSLLSEAMMFDSENYLLKCLQKEKRQSTFAHLIERSRYNRRRKQLNGLTEKVRRVLVNQMAGGETVFLIDSMPIEICKFARAKRLRICQADFETTPSFGGCVSMLKTYFGYKLHAVTTCQGIITHFELTKANVADIHFLKHIKHYYAGCLLLGDRAYLSNPLQQNSSRSFESYLTLLYGEIKKITLYSLPCFEEPENVSRLSFHSFMTNSELIEIMQSLLRASPQGSLLKLLLLLFFNLSIYLTTRDQSITLNIASFNKHNRLINES